jgi:hypothetical protein
LFHAEEGSMRKFAIAGAWFSAMALTAAAFAAAEKTSSAVGVVTEYSAASHSFAIRTDSAETLRFQWNDETRFNGVVSRGMKVSVRYTETPDGSNLARTVGVLK